jgi:tetratricopeptide (TPR) repeat protein
MVNTQAQELFEQANRLWFFEGQTHQAVDLYQQALTIVPNDPVILFQWARALWSLEQLGDARAALQKAQAHSSELSPHGVEMLKNFEKTLQRGLAFGRRLPVRIEALDTSQLQHKTLSNDDWMAIADTAQERGMYGVALYAFEHGKGSVVSFDEEREQGALIKAARSAVASLRAMRAST